MPPKAEITKEMIVLAMMSKMKSGHGPRAPIDNALKMLAESRIWKEFRIMIARR